MRLASLAADRTHVVEDTGFEIDERADDVERHGFERAKGHGTEAPWLTVCSDGPSIRAALSLDVPFCVGDET
ncbi:hypothetical protein GCM10009304_18940 [Pseudomonas matsuisoli]|uniref:Uncharacterized protein n=1 Tax=Pseudomonas matsuisoli TaxID=1515666 RepID=A0A917UWZ8_9PSED|nr:hypothetical protein GCM10009304_18940 [Pseudomonas matsuisoli]